MVICQHHEVLSQPHAQMKQPWPGMSDESAPGHPWAVVTKPLVGMSQWLAKMSQQKKVSCGGGWDESATGKAETAAGWNALAMIDNESASGQWGYIASARHGDESAVGNE